MFQCENNVDTSLPEYSCLKDMPRCNMFYIWAVGARPFNTPNNVGFQIGSQFNNIVMQVHYDNMFNLKNQFDSSGIKVYSTPNFRLYTAGIMILGVNLPQINIPPKLIDYKIENSCNNTCSKEDINIFSYGFHMHTIGKKISTEIWRDNKLISYQDDNDYDFNKQDLRIFNEEIILKKYDILISKCSYNSLNRLNITKGGLPSSDEMCFNYVFFYPKKSGPQSCISKSCSLYVK